MADKLIEVNHDFNSTSRIKNLPSSTQAGEPVVHEQLTAALEGLAWKDNVAVATQGNLNLSSPGASIDGVAMTAGDRVLVKAQTAQSQNGIYVWTGAATAMTRATDASTAAGLTSAVTLVDQGTSAGTRWRQTSVGFTLDTDPVVWADFGTAVPDASETTKGIAELATQSETDTGTDDARTITPLKLANWSGRKRKAVATIGDGSATQFDVTHNFGTRDVEVTVYRNSGEYDDTDVHIGRPSTNAVRLTFSSAPANNSRNVVIIG